MSMSRNTKVGIGSVIVAALFIGVLVGSQESNPRAPGPADPPPGSSPYPRTVPTPVAPSPEPLRDQCQYEEEFATWLPMYVSTGETNLDLVMCTDVTQTGSLVKNTSSSTVYYLARGDQGAYWDENTDASRGADVRMFWAAMRRGVRRSRQPAFVDD